MSTVPISRECVEDHHANSPEEFLDVLSPRHPIWRDEAEAWIYRGHADAEWTLKPSAVRDLQSFAKFGLRADPRRVAAGAPDWDLRSSLLEEMLLRFRNGLNQSGIPIPTDGPRIGFREFSAATSNAEPPRETFPLMALAQHHGLPTLLLDWTRRAWIAAYFAAVEAADASRGHHGTHLAVWALRRGGAYATVEGPTFFDPPASTNPNLRAQCGVFTVLTQYEDDPSIEEHFARRKKHTGSSPPLRRMTLPVSAAKKLLRLLSCEGIDGASMFPGADGVVRAMRERVLWEGTGP